MWKYDVRVYKEEEIIIGLIKEAQTEYFEHTKLSTDEYSTSITQYEARLNKIIQRRVELETEKKDFFARKSRSVRLQDEKVCLEELVRGLQRSYLEEGKVESRAYENRMKSYVNRLSEVEEAIAISEAETRMGAERSLLRKLFAGQKAAAPRQGEAQATARPAQETEVPQAKGREARAGKEKKKEKK